jgi:LysM repeat protein
MGMSMWNILRPTILAVALLGTAGLHAQEVRTVAGRRFIVHTVQQGQTLYAVARANAVTVEELLSANPGAADGLSIGEELLIPQDAVDRKAMKTAPALSNDGVLRHTVQRKETLFGVSRTYGVDVNALIAANPEATSGLREGMVLVVPVSAAQGQTETAVRPALPERRVDHVVQASETLYGLAKRYSTTVEAIQAANSGLPEGLKVGSTVIVPLPPGVEPPAPEPVVTPDPDRGRTVRIAYLLPFSTAANDSALGRDPQQPQFHAVTRMAASFYAGARMALDSLQAVGLKAEVRVKDSGESPAAWGPLVRSSELAGTDLFIGPFHRGAIEQLSREQPSSHIVCPVPQSNRVILGMANVSKIVPARSDLLRLAGRYAVQRHAKENILLLRPEIAADKEGQEQLQRSINGALAEVQPRLRDTVLVARPGKRDMKDLIAKLDAKRENVIVTSCEDVEFVTTLVSTLKQRHETFAITVIGPESWLRMETVALEDLDKLRFTFAAQGFADPTDPAVRAFEKAYQERYRTDVDEYAYLGYDITRYYVHALMDGRSISAEGLNGLMVKPLYQGFKLMSAGPENGLRNDYGIMLRQQELRLVPAP